MTDEQIILKWKWWKLRQTSKCKHELVLQVEAIAVRKYGSLDNLELHHEQQQMAKTKKHITKRKEESQKVLLPPVNIHHDESLFGISLNNQMFRTSLLKFSSVDNLLKCHWLCLFSCSAAHARRCTTSKNTAEDRDCRGEHCFWSGGHRYCERRQARAEICLWGLSWSGAHLIYHSYLNMYTCIRGVSSLGNGNS